MKTQINMRSLASVLMVLCLLTAPVAALSKKGEKNYQRGLEHEAAQRWEQAVQEFTLAVAADPSNTTYQLHYRRAVFNASQTYMQQGRSLAEQHDYAGAYNAFRQAYGLDPVNQLALSEMDRMLRLQAEKDGTTPPAGQSGASSPGEVKVTPSSYQDPGTGGTPAAPSTNRGNGSQDVEGPRTQQLKVISYSGDLKAFIRSLADQLNLNVVFDRQSFTQPRTIDVNYKDVTTAQALDYIFLQENLFFQKLNRRTILVADQTRRPQYQQLVIRTFYLANMDPNDASQLIQRAIPPSQGRPQTIVIPDKLTNSITVRDTIENVRLIGDLIQSVDKDRAEVVMDVNIYEISRTDLLRFGNQIGTDSTLTNLGFTSGGIASRAGLGRVLANPTIVGAGFALPVSTIQALQDRQRTNLIASTQVHAFNGEESTARIGQRVPVQTAQTYPFGVNNTGGNTTTAGGQFSFPTGGYPVINYEPTGLTLKFTPQVFPNLDVQVKMSIESKDVLNPGSATPTFTERTITGTARIQNNRTMMLASVAQDKQSNGRTGLPLLGLTPLLGRLFTAPTRNNDRTDIVIAVTPRVLRAPTVTPQDEVPRNSGTLQTPTNGSLEALVQEADHEDQLAASRVAQNSAGSLRVPATNVVVPLPDEPPPAYVPAPKALAAGGADTAAKNADLAAGNAARAQTVNVSLTGSRGSGGIAPQAIGASQSLTTSIRPSAPVPSVDLAAALKTLLPVDEPPAYVPAPRSVTGSASAPATGAVTSGPERPAGATGDGSMSGATLHLAPEHPQMQIGERQRIAVILTTGSYFNAANLKLSFDPRTIAVRGIEQGSLFTGVTGVPTVSQSIDPRGILSASVALPQGMVFPTGANVVLFINIEAVGAGDSPISFDQGGAQLAGADGHRVPAQSLASHVVVKQ